MAVNIENLKIYNFVVDEIRPVTTSQQKADWERRMESQAKQKGFKTQEGVRLFDTCCGGNPDDCGIAS